jgi:hypothetical protein
MKADVKPEAFMVAKLNEIGHVIWPIPDSIDMT